MRRVPGVESPLEKGQYEDGRWWIKFTLDIDHPLAWRVVQELGHVVNYLSLEERLPTVYYPVSPPPYMNGGPEEYLSWIIESTQKDFHSGKLAEWLESRLPSPVDDLSQWEEEEDDE